MKKFFSVLLVLCVAAVSFGAAFAGTALPGGPFKSSIQIQNMGNAEATATLQYYKADGTMAYTTTHQILAGDVLSIYVPGEASLASGEYSVVVSANQPVAAVSNFSDADSGGSYSGASTGSPSWNFPGVYDNYYGYYTEIYAQNVNAMAQNITLEVFAPGASVAVYTSTKTNVPAYSSVSWSLKDLPQLNKNVSYSAKVTANAEIVCMGNSYGSGATAPQLYSYNGFSSGAVKFYVPGLYKNYYGWNASLAIQNVGVTVATVAVTYETGFVQNLTIQPNSSQSIVIANVSELTKGAHSATVTSDIDVVVSVNMSNAYNRAATYNGASSATTKVYVANVMKKYYGYSSSITCQNLGNANTAITVTYAGQAAATETSAPIAPGAGIEFYLPARINLPNKYNGSATITADQPIVCIVNSNMEDAPYKTQSMDAFYSYNGVNQ